MSERCPECRGEGEYWSDRNGRWQTCERCGGEGRIDPYQQDEWYEDAESYCEDYPEACGDEDDHLIDVNYTIRAEELQPGEDGYEESFSMHSPEED